MAAIKTKLKLLKLFDTYNNKYWDGKLPVINIELQEIKNTYGEYTSPDNANEDCESAYCIAINARMHWRNKKSLRKTLLHEMCHHAIFIKNKELFWKNEIQ